MTLASTTADLAEQALLKIADIRCAVPMREREERLISSLHGLLVQIHSDALDELYDEDHAPLTQEQVTRP